jgi:hypothetical protein
VPQHGAIFDTFVAFIQSIVGHNLYTYAVLTALTGVAGVIAIALCGYELAGWWGALLAALALWLYPRYFGAIFNNPKDIPFAAAMIWLLWSTLLLVKRWSKGKKSIWYSVLVGFFLGLAASIRVIAIFWFAVLVLLAAGWWLLYGLRIWKERKLLPTLVKQTSTGIIIGLTSLIMIILCWPYIFIDPIHNLYDSIQVMQKYPWDGMILFNGGIYSARHLPRSYVPTWLVIGSPPTLVIFFLVGLLAVLLIALRKRFIEPSVAVIILAFFVPFSSIIVLRSVLYDALRQFLFLIPLMILIAVYGLIQFYRYLITHKQKLIAIAMIALTLLSYGLVIQRMMELHPYEYIYFSPVVGSLAAANQNYQVDYWGTCEKEAGEWVAQNYRQYTNKANPTMISIGNWEFLSKTYLPSNFQIDGQNPDFYILFYHDAAGPSDFSKFPTYKLVHTVSRDNTTLCIVKVNPNLQK